MARLGRLFLIIAVCVNSGTALSAQDVYIENVREPQIILPTGLRPWQGTPQELSRINRVSVPASYKERCEAEELPYTTIHTTVTTYRCFHDLMNWHFDFGTEGSAQEALRYIAERMTFEFDLSSGAARRYIELLPRGLAEAEDYLHSKNLTYEKFIEENRVIDAELYPAMAELWVLSQTFSKTSDLVSFYIDAADWHRSPSLLDEATRWYGYLPPPEPPPAEESFSGPERLLRRVAYFRQGEFLGGSLAVARAATNRTEESILAAHEWSARAFDPAFQDRELRDYKLRSRAERYRYLRFRVQLLASLHSLDVRRYEQEYLGNYDFEDMENLFRREDRSPRDMRYPDDGETRLFIEVIVANGEIAVEKANSCSNKEYFLEDELGILFNGGQIVLQSRQPAPYRRIAELYLDLFSTLQKCKDDQTFGYLTLAHYHNQARQYQYFLDNYDEIALGR
ncbi:hypothetical protein [Qipengyuania sp. JC766]|uniref:hypothetical protein n=1 Tax=Qipengyuania sp. JC766 TaxID=3232139 RepID=UPI003458C945